MPGRLGVLFTCPERTRGSQWSVFQGLMPALHRLRPDLVHFSFSDVESRLPGVRMVRVPPPLVPGNPLRTLAGLYRQQVETARAVRAEGCSHLLVPFTIDMLRRSPVPQTVVIHDLLALRYPQWFPQTSLYWRFHLIPSLRSAHRVIAVSENTKRDLVELLGLSESRIRVVPNGFTPMSEGDPRLRKPGSLLYVSSGHQPHKNVDGLLRAFAGVRARCADATLLVVGKHDPRYTPVLRDLAASLGVAQAVRFEENLSPEALVQAYREAELFVYPSLYEGFGIPPLEAMASGAPVVASDSGAVAEVCGEAALPFDARSPESIQAAILRGLTDEALRAELVAKGRARCREFSWDAAAQGMIEAVEA